MRRTPQVQSVTSVAPSRQQDISGRTRRYLTSMGIRTVCLVGAVLADGWLRWALVVAAVGLPWVAVVMANTAGRRSAAPPTVVSPDAAALLPPDERRPGPTG